MFQGSLMGVSMKYLSRIFYASYMDRKFQGCFKQVLRVLQGCFEAVSIVFQRSSKDDSRKF